ncbi:MAG: response regulator transcription factor [Paenibacillaceae bacterium]|nr:response regulator transcription factor [Paenibacillaceae bacterium]
MYNVMIVDDEDKIRRGIRTIVPWPELGFTVQDDAASAMEALKRMEAEGPPDVVLTDIRMPLMDGIALLEQIKQRYEGVEVMILSGYDYFEYAQKALELGAFDYILKPTKLPELTAKFRRLKETLDRRNRDKRLIERGASEERERTVRRLLFGPEEAATDAVEAFSGSDPFVLVIQLQGFPDDNTIAEAKRLLAGELDRRGMLPPVIDDSRRLAVVGADEQATRLAGELLHVLQQAGLRAAIGIGGPAAGPGGVRDACREAAAAASRSFFRGFGAVIPYDPRFADNERPAYPQEAEKRLAEAIDRGDRTAVSRAIGELFATAFDNERLEPEQVRAICLELVLLLSRHFKSLSERIVELFDEDRLLHARLAEFETLAQLKDGLLASFMLVIDCVLDSRDNSHSRIVKAIRKIVAERYREPLSLQTIAHSLFMNPDYVSRLFRKETGLGFVDYLNEYRIERAKELLNDITVKSYEVGYWVGYQNPNYFSKIFKKVTGKSVTDYREG